MTPEISSAAKQSRLFCYYRITNSSEAINELMHRHEVRFSFELTRDWYDPTDGDVPMPDGISGIVGSHAVPLRKFDPETKRFRFPNSWGNWGKHGWGSVSQQFFDEFLIEAWNVESAGFEVPLGGAKGITCVEWKWVVSPSFGVHGREIVDATNDERLAWAFCVNRGRTLDIEEFFVWPTARGNGFGRVLAGMVEELANQMKLPLRMLVSFADTEEQSIRGVRAVADLLDLKIYESLRRDVHIIGEKTVRENAINRRRPDRPAFILERLWPIDEAPLEKILNVPVLFGTDRQVNPPAGKENSERSFSGSRGDRLELGIAYVEIEKTPKFGSVGRTWLERISPVKREHLPAPAVYLLSERDFIDEIRKQNEDSDELASLLYIHGYNVTFDQAIKQAARFAADLKITGSTFLYSWPSAGKTLSYAADEASIEAGLPFFMQYIELLFKNCAGQRINMLVHSMGNRAILKSLSDRVPLEHEAGIGQIVFAAPDVDSTVFKQFVPQVLRISNGATLYATNADIALKASSVLHGYHRAGLAPPVLTFDGLDTVVVDGFNLFDLGHSYYSNAAPLLHDMFMLFRHDAKPDSRPQLMETKTTEGKPYWRLTL